MAARLPLKGVESYKAKDRDRCFAASQLSSLKCRNDSCLKSEFNKRLTGKIRKDSALKY